MDEIDNTKKTTGIFANKKLLILLLLILSLGIFVRLYKFSDVGYWSDDESTLPTGLLWFFPHNFYPGLLGQGEPALGNYIIAKGCMMSGEDFSGVTQIQRRFYPGREILIGKQLVNANNYCHAPMYIFSILFLLAITLLSFLLLKKHGAILVIGLVSFNTFMLVFGRWIHVDMMLYTFVTLGLIALFKSLKSQKGSISEKIWWIIAIAMMALSFSTKLPSSVYIVFSGIVISVKYWNEVMAIFQKGCRLLDLEIIKGHSETPHQKSFLYIIGLAFIVYFGILFFTFEGFANIPAVIEAYRVQGAEFGTLNFYRGSIASLIRILKTFSNLEMIFLIATIAYFPFLLKKSLKGSIEEKFIASLILLFLIMPAIAPSMKLERVFFLFSFGWFLSAGMLMDNLISRFKSFRNNLFIVAMLLIFSIPVFNAVYTSPDFLSDYKLYNILNSPTKISWSSNNFGARPIGEYLQGLLKENETYFPAEPMTMVTYYVKNNQQLQYYLFRENFKAKVGRSPTVHEYIQYFQPNNERIKYLLIDKYTQNNEEFVQDILQNYEPMHIIYQPSIRKVETIRVYDLDNLVKKK